MDDAGASNESIEHDAETGTYRAFFSKDDSASETVVSVVAAARGTDPLELDSLYPCVDPDALDALMATAASHPSSGDVRVSFSFAGHDVTVGSHGTVVVDPSGNETA